MTIKAKFHFECLTETCHARTSCIPAPQCFLVSPSEPSQVVRCTRSSSKYSFTYIDQQRLVAIWCIQFGESFCSWLFQGFKNEALEFLCKLTMFVGDKNQNVIATFEANSKRPSVQIRSLASLKREFGHLVSPLFSREDEKSFMLFSYAPK